MASAMFFSRIGGSGGCMELPTGKGKVDFNHGVALSRQLLPDDPRGTFTLTFPSVKVGSEIHLFLPDTTEIGVGVESSTTGQVITIPRYLAGNARNNVRVLITNLAYYILDFTLTLTADSSIPTFQRVDTNYNNPS